MIRILLADDDADDRMLFEEVFSSLPSDEYKLNTVSNGEEVISLLHNTNNPTHLPDLIVLDQNMPALNGRETLGLLKKDPVYSEIPVIIYSTYNEKSFIRECEEQGVMAVVSKPDSYEGYIQMINNFLKYAVKSSV